MARSCSEEGGTSLSPVHTECTHTDAGTWLSRGQAAVSQVSCGHCLLFCLFGLILVPILSLLRFPAARSHWTLLW